MHLERNKETYTLQNLISVAFAAITSCILDEKSIFAVAIALRVNLRNLLLPHLEVNSGFRVILLPSEFGVLSVRAVREAEYTLVLIDHASLLIASPVNMDAKWRCAAEGTVILVDTQDWEVVCCL
jgi:hypothetical protein